jgi:hypothetical protein
MFRTIIFLFIFSVFISLASCQSKAQLRIVHGAALDNDQVEFSISPGGISAGNFRFGDTFPSASAGEFASVPATTYSLNITQQGRIVYQNNNINLQGGYTYTVVVTKRSSAELNPYNSFPLQLDVNKVQVPRVSRAFLSNLNFIHAAPLAPVVNLKVGKYGSSQRVGYGDQTGYQEYPYNSVPVKTSVNTSDRKNVITAKYNPEQATSYQAVVIGSPYRNDEKGLTALFLGDGKLRN